MLGCKICTISLSKTDLDVRPRGAESLFRNCITARPFTFQTIFASDKDVLVIVPDGPEYRISTLAAFMIFLSSVYDPSSTFHFVASLSVRLSYATYFPSHRIPFKRVENRPTRVLEVAGENS